MNEIVKKTIWWPVFLEDVTIDVHLAAGLEWGQHPGHLQATAPRTLNTTQYSHFRAIHVFIPYNRPMDQIYSKTPNSKCRLWPVKVLGGRCLSVWGPLPSYDGMTPYSPPYKLYTCVHYTHAHREGGGERANQRECYWGNSSQSRSVENTNMTDCISSL